MEYELVVRDGIESMNEAVNEMLQDGWRLQGGISVTATSRIYYYCQAMVRDENTMINQEDLKGVIKRTNKDIKEFLSKYN